jgi:hypothetical protein
LEAFHLHLRELPVNVAAVAADPVAARESQQRRSALLHEALKGQVLFYEVIDGVQAPYPKAPRMLKPGALVKPRFFNPVAQAMAQDEGMGDLLFEFWASEIAAFNYHLLFHTNMLCPRFHFYQRVSPYILGGPHLLMNATSLFWSMIALWLASGQKAVFPVDTKRRQLDKTLLLSTWRDIDTNWTGIFTRALKAEHSVLCQWFNSPNQALASFPKKNTDPDHPPLLRCAGAPAGPTAPTATTAVAAASDGPNACPFFHQPLDKNARQPVKSLARDMVTLEDGYHSASECSSDEDDDDDDDDEGDEEVEVAEKVGEAGGEQNDTGDQAESTTAAATTGETAAAPTSE